MKKFTMVFLVVLFVSAGIGMNWVSGSSGVETSMLGASLVEESSQWIIHFGPSGGSGTSAMERTSDGGYIVAGYTDAYGMGDLDLWVLKLNSAGNIVWQRTYGDANRDFANAMQETSDGGFIIAGVRQNYSPYYRTAWMLKLDSMGNIEWQKFYATGAYPQAVRQTDDGGFIVAGNGFSAIWAMKLDQEGNVNWNKYFEEGNEEGFPSIEVVTHMDWGPNTLEDTTTHLQETLKNQHSDDRNFPFAVVLKSDLGTAFVPPDQVYQHKRIHSALGYLTPAEFEAQWLTKQLP